LFGRGQVCVDHEASPHPPWMNLDRLMALFVKLASCLVPRKKDRE
jgi:hypothetical protein